MYKINLLILLFSTLLFACTSSTTTEEETSTQPSEMLQPTENQEMTTPKSPQSLDAIFDQIRKFPKVQERSKYVEKQSDGKRKLELKLQQEPSANDPFYWIEAGEDNGSSFVPHFQFAIDEKTKEIFYYDDLSGQKITLEEWNKMKGIPLE